MRTIIFVLTLVSFSATASAESLVSQALVHASRVELAQHAPIGEPSEPVRRRSVGRTVGWTLVSVFGLGALATPQNCVGFQVGNRCAGRVENRTALWTTGAIMTGVGALGLWRWSHVTE